MDYIGVRRISPDGEIVGEARMLGLFTTKAYSEPRARRRCLHRKLRQILRSEDLIEGSHDYKASVSLFDSFPKDELFAASTDDLRGAVVALLALAGRAGAAARPPRSGHAERLADRRAAALALRRRPAEAPADAVRERSRPTRSTTIWCSARATALQVHFRVHAAGGLLDLDFRELEGEVVAAPARGTTSCGRRWWRATASCRAARWRAEWGARFPRYYKASTTAALAVHDIGCFARLQALGEPFVVGLQNERDERGERTRVGLYKSGGKVELSAAMPMLEDLGLRVLEEVPTRLAGGDGDTWVQDFGCWGRATRRSTCRRTARGGRLHLGGLARGHGVRPTEPARARRGPGLAPDRDPARVPQVPPAHRLALHRELPERHAGRERGADRQARRPLRAAASTPSTSATRRPRRRCARRSWPRWTRSSRSTTTASCATSSG
jgi:glutamate dehydrogenase